MIDDNRYLLNMISVESITIRTNKKGWGGGGGWGGGRVNLVRSW